MNFYLLHFKCLREMGNGFSQQNLVIREFPVNADVRIPVTSSKDWQSRITKILSKSNSSSRMQQETRSPIPKIDRIFSKESILQKNTAAKNH